MENRPEDEVAAQAVLSKWRNLVRQQSVKIGTLADNIVLPKNERTIRPVVAKAEKMEMQTVDMQDSRTYAVSEDGSTKKKTEHFPAFMIGISVVQIFLFYSFDEDILSMKFAYDPHRRHEVWRFITVMLVHSGYMHLWGNVIMQLILGVFLEIVHQWKRIAIIYLAAVFGGSLCTTVLDNASYAVGASGGVMGLVFSHVATIILNWNEMDRKFSRLFCVSAYIFYDIGTDVYSGLILKEESNTSHAGHLGGAITGFLMSILVLKNFKKHPWEKTLQNICVGILIAICVIVFVINVTAWDYYPQNEWNFDYQRSYNEAFDDDDDDDYYDDNDANATEATTEMYDADR